MTIAPYFEFKERSLDGFRAVVVTPFPEGGGRVDFVTPQDDHLIMDVTDLAFLERIAKSLPAWLLDGAAMQAPPAPLAPADAPAEEEPASAAPERAGKRWSEEEEEQLRASYIKGYDVPALSKQHNRTPTAIITRIIALGLAKVVPTVERQRLET